MKTHIVAYKQLIAVTVAVIIIIGLGLALWTGEGTEPVVEASTPEIVDHTEFWREENITTYEGSETCIKCHEDEVYEVFHSYHYQMASKVQDIAGAGAVLFGGKYAYNDFCGAIFWRGNVSINYIGKAILKAPPPGYEDLEGTLIATGCSMCHGVSMGLPPSPEPSPEQLGNIDCLACHASPDVYLSGGIGVKKGYRIVYQDEDGVWHYKINPNISIETLARSILDKPTSKNCLACHAYSGGGPHYKRPNISPDMLERPEEFDVHLAAGLQCIDCHVSEDHAFPTRSADTWNRENGHVPSCTDCHGTEPHGGIKGWIINRIHLDRVSCQACHIPYIAHGEYPTDVARNWSEAEFIPEAAKYEPVLRLERGIEPVYAWYNGTRQVYLWPEPVEPVNGSIIYVKPLGSREDPDSKIYPFKLHTAIVPYSSVNRTPVPIKVGIVFATGNITAAVKAGAATAGMNWTGDWVTLVRYMQVNHGVRPADEALQCLDCHGPTIRRMPWPELGYGHYPEIAFTLILAAVAVVVGYLGFRVYRRIR